MSTDTPQEPPKLWQLVNRAFNELHYAGGIGLKYIVETDTAEQAFAKIEGNIRRLDETLRSVSERHNEREARLSKFNLLMNAFKFLAEEIKS